MGIWSAQSDLIPRVVMARVPTALQLGEAASHLRPGSSVGQHQRAWHAGRMAIATLRGEGGM